MSVTYSKPASIRARAPFSDVAALLANPSVLIFSELFFTLYRMFQRRCNWNRPLIDSIAYSVVATFGLYALITWLLNAANDAYVLLFHSDPHLLAAALDSWTNITAYVLLAIFLSVSLVHTCGRLMHECVYRSFSQNFYMSCM